MSTQKQKSRSMTESGFALCLLLMVFLSSCSGVTFFAESDESLSISDKSVRIAHADVFMNFNPHQNTPTAKNRLGNIYEGLIAFDANFRIQPKLAVYWGNSDENTWVFTLRPHVTFHDNTPLTSQDVVYSFEMAMESQELAGSLSNIRSITADNTTIEISTEDPDPLLLSKIQNVYIVPEGYFESEDYKWNRPNGTGPYSFVSLENDEMRLTRNETYWGPAPYYKDAIILTVPGRNERVNQLLAGNIDVLGAVPPQKVMELRNNGTIQVYDYPSLTIYFLGFRLSPEIKDKANPLTNKDMRAALAEIADPEEFIASSSGSLEKTSQLISANIFGFNPEWENPLDTISISEILDENELKQGFIIRMVTTEDIEKTALLLKTQLDEYKIKLLHDIEPPESIIESIKEDNAHIFILGWKFDTADASIFLSDFFHTPTEDGKYGSYNVFNYSNPRMDKKIEDQEVEFDIETRREMLQEIFQEISKEQIAIPLFEAKQFYATQSNVVWEPRLDGQVLAAEMRE